MAGRVTGAVYLALARRLVAEGRIGQVRHVRAQYLQDWLSDPDAPFTWRLDSNRAGSGALGDIGAHSIDTAQWLTGDHIEGVSATMRTFVDTRPLLGEQVDLVRVIAGDGVAAPSFAEAARVQRVLAAVEASAHADSTYVTVEGSPS